MLTMQVALGLNEPPVVQRVPFGGGPSEKCCRVFLMTLSDHSDSR